jgi:hypothetical protein
VTSTAVGVSDLPPGVRRLIDHVGKPWSGKLSQYNVELSAELGGKDEYKDRCIHIVGSGDEENNPDRLVSVKFDWQRTYAFSRPIAVDAIRKLVAVGRGGALDYFEEVAEGSRFDEEIHNKSRSA